MKQILDVICPNCCQSYHETSEEFDPHSTPHGGMVRLKDPWRKWGWSSFGCGRPPKLAEKKETTPCAQMDCPQCSGPLAINRKLKVRHKDGSAYIPGPKEPVSNNCVESQEPVTTEDKCDVEESREESRDETILRLRSEGMSYKNIGLEVGLSAEGVRQIVKKAKL